MAASSQISMCFPFAFPFVFQVPAAWVVFPAQMMMPSAFYSRRDIMTLKFPFIAFIATNYVAFEDPLNAFVLNESRFPT